VPPARQRSTGESQIKRESEEVEKVPYGPYAYQTTVGERRGHAVGVGFKKRGGETLTYKCSVGLFRIERTMHNERRKPGKTENPKKTEIREDRWGGILPPNIRGFLRAFENRAENRGGNYLLEKGGTVEGK